MTQIADLIKKMDSAAIYYEGDDCAGTNLWRELKAALPFLPIAVEGKAGLVPAKAAEFSRMVREYGANSDNDHGARMQEDLEMFLMENLCEIEAALISSPGKDGGQEVESVGEAAELARLRAIALDMQAGYVEATERAEEAVKAANALQTEVDLLRSTIDEPASTALVERLTTFDRDYPEFYWHVAKGKNCAGEPLYGAIITRMNGTEIGHGESNVSAEAAFEAAFVHSGLPALYASHPTEGER